MKALLWIFEVKVEDKCKMTLEVSCCPPGYKDLQFLYIAIIFSIVLIVSCNPFTIVSIVINMSNHCTYMISQTKICGSIQVFKIKPIISLSDFCRFIDNESNS